MIRAGGGRPAVAKYMARRPHPPSPSWRTFLKQHLEAIAAIDMFIVISATFQMLYVVIVLKHDRRKIAHFEVTRHPTQVWLALQVTEAFPWDTAPRSPWQNAYVERVIGSIRSAC